MAWNMYYSENEIICALISFLLHGIACLLFTTCKTMQGGGGHGEVRAECWSTRFNSSAIHFGWTKANKLITLRKISATWTTCLSFSTHNLNTSVLLLGCISLWYLRVWVTPLSGRKTWNSSGLEEINSLNIHLKDFQSKWLVKSPKTVLLSSVFTLDKRFKQARINRLHKPSWPSGHVSHSWWHICFFSFRYLTISVCLYSF